MFIQEDMNLMYSLKTLAGVTEINETFGNRKGIEFNFNNSLKSNYCKLVEYNVNNQEMFIIQLRKQGTDYNGNEYDKLVFESVIKEQEFKDIFEKQTGIYISALEC